MITISLNILITNDVTMIYLSMKATCNTITISLNILITNDITIYFVV
jgi:hypothetical protein